MITTKMNFSQVAQTLMQKPVILRTSFMKILMENVMFGYLIVRRQKIMSQMIDMTGWIMAEHGVPDSLITIIGIDEEWEQYRKENHLKKGAKWLCKCSCGSNKIFSVLGSDLKRKDGKGTRSCGCLRQKQMDNFWRETFVDLTNQRFGSLVAIEKISKSETGRINKRSVAYWKCQCDCGNFCIAGSTELRAGSVKSCGCLKRGGNSFVKKILQNNGINFEEEFSFIDLKYINPLHFDFKINTETEFFLLEIQGVQHFKAVEYFGGEEAYKKQLYHDKLKREYCKEHNIVLYEIPYIDMNTKELEEQVIQILKKESVLSQDQIFL